MIGQLIAQWFVVGIPVAGLCGMVWYIATWKEKVVLAAPAPLPKSQTELDEENRKYRQWQDIKDVIFVVLFCMALAVGGFVLLALVAFSFMIDFGPVAPTTVIAFLLVLILFKMHSK